MMKPLETLLGCLQARNGVLKIKMFQLLESILMQSTEQISVQGTLHLSKRLKEDSNRPKPPHRIRLKDSIEAILTLLREMKVRRRKHSSLLLCNQQMCTRLRLRTYEKLRTLAYRKCKICIGSHKCPISLIRIKLHLILLTSWEMRQLTYIDLNSILPKSPSFSNYWENEQAEIAQQTLHIMEPKSFSQTTMTRKTTIQSTVHPSNQTLMESTTRDIPTTSRATQSCQSIKLCSKLENQTLDPWLSLEWEETWEKKFFLLRNRLLISMRLRAQWTLWKEHTRRWMILRRK